MGMPYFFHLRQVRDGALEIREVDEGGLAEGALFDWPLPWNLFRHRMLGYRFGLRASEAISLARSDWVTTSGACVVVISARHRSTKSFAGRRQIPLMGTFSDHEQLIVESWLKHWELFAPKDPNAPLFFSEVTPKIPTKVQPHRTRIVSTLRAVCSNSDVTLHHARHSFANLLALRLIFPSCWTRTPLSRSASFGTHNRPPCNS